MVQFLFIFAKICILIFLCNNIVQPKFIKIGNGNQYLTRFDYFGLRFDLFLRGKFLPKIHGVSN